jgi:hypothetical protein
VTGLDVTGGGGGVGAALEDLTAAAGRLAEAAADLSDVAGALLRAGLTADLVSVAVTNPVDAGRIAVSLTALAGPSGLPTDAAALAALAITVRSAVAAYEAGEVAVATLVESAQDAVVLAASRQAPLLAVGVVAAERSGVDVGAAADRLLFAVPGLADLAGGVEGVVAGPATPWDYEGGLTLLAAAGSRGGWLTEAGHRVRVTEVATGVPVATPGATPAATPAAAPESVADLVAAQADLAGPVGGPDRIRVVQVPQADGSAAWVVVVPGTQDWSPRAGPNPSDLTSDLLLMAQQATLLAAGVERALESAQREAGRAGLADPVLVAGHSQGGIVAAALAADPAFRQRQRVTHVVASGAPIARMPVPADVSVLALEHRQDAVPRLEGARNADQRGWVTVTRDLRGEVRTAGAAHAAARYRDTAALVDASASRSLAAWREGSEAFLAGSRHGPQTVRDFRVERVGPAP